MVDGIAALTTILQYIIFTWVRQSRYQNHTHRILFECGGWM